MSSESASTIATASPFPTFTLQTPVSGVGGCLGRRHGTKHQPAYLGPRGGAVLAFDAALPTAGGGPSNHDFGRSVQPTTAPQA